MKKNMLICAPVTSRSGYGDHARDLVKSLIEHDKYHIKIMDVPWGSCPRNALDKNNKIDKNIFDLILKYNESIETKPDIYVDIRIPNEFQQLGKYNIGITAGIETDIVSGEWLEGCNKMDLVIVPSEHSKKGFIDSVYDKINTLPNGQQQKIGELKLEKPIEVLFEGSDTTIFKTTDNITETINNTFNSIKEDFAYLVVGQWCQGGFGEDRKDLGTTIKCFYEAFANKKKQPALILKTSGATYSIMDREDILKKINNVKEMFPKDLNLPNIYLLHGGLSSDEMNSLYNHPKVKCMVSFTHGEGFGRPLLEATMTGLPVMATNWSGQLDFLDNDKTLLLPGNLEDVPRKLVDNQLIVEGSKWFKVNQGYTHKFFEHSFKNINELKVKANQLMKKNVEKFSLENMTKKFDEIMEKYTKDMPQQVSLNLPKLKKVDKTKAKPVMELPKLKKVSDGVKV